MSQIANLEPTKTTLEIAHQIENEGIRACYLKWEEASAVAVKLADELSETKTVLRIAESANAALWEEKAGLEKDRSVLNQRIHNQRAEIARLHEAEDAAVRSGKEQFQRANNAEAERDSLSLQRDGWKDSVDAAAQRIKGLAIEAATAKTAMQGMRAERDEWKAAFIAAKLENDALKFQLAQAETAESQLASIAALLSQIADSPEPREALWKELYERALQKGGGE